MAKSGAKTGSSDGPVGGATGGASAGVRGPVAVSPAPAGALSPLAKELGKLRPFEHPSQEAALSLVRTVAMQQAEVEALLKREGLSPSSYNILRILRHAPEGRTCSEVGSHLVARVPDVTRLLDNLERRGLIERGRSNTDRRVVRVRITPGGLEVLERLDGPVVELHRAHFAHLSEREVRELIGLLDKVRARPAGGA